MTRKIAPTLAEAIEVAKVSDLDWKQARKELRALLAVARAAEAQTEHNWKHRSPGTTLDKDGSCLCYLCRDLARLRRVSGGKGTRHG